MAWRPRNNRSTYKTEIFGDPKLTLAHFIVLIENIVKTFAQPLLVAGVFMVCAWLGVFTGLYPWAHLVALIVFLVSFFYALGQSRLAWQMPSVSLARRRVEDASQLKHRPLDVLDDRPAVLDEGTITLWRAHVDKTQSQLHNLRWPQWTLNFSDRDPYALRHGLLIMLVLSMVVGWGSLGGRLVASINPTIGKIRNFNPTLDAWITPPEYTGLPPIMIATPAGLRLHDQVITVPEGSTISVHLMEKDGPAPELSVNNDSVEFTNDEHGDYQVSEAIHEGDTIAIRHGWQELGSWKIRLVSDQSPKIAFAETPSVSERKSIRLSYDASDDYGVTSVRAQITPRESLPGATTEPQIIPLTEGRVKELHRVDYQDLTASPWSGLPVDIKLIAQDGAGHEVETESKTITLPEREFFHPIARALVEERKRLLQSPYDDGIRNEVANVMANVAQHPSNYQSDPVVLMALRSGAVRLVLGHGEDVVSPISAMLWQSALRIEDGNAGLAEQDLRRAQKDLAEALDRGANEAEINKLIDRLHQALSRYLSELSTRMAAQPGPIEDLGALTGDKTNTLTPQDLEQMLEKMRDLSATGQRDGARQELSKLQQLLESLRTGPSTLTEKQKAELSSLKALREITKNQKDLMDRTFQHAQTHDSHETPHLANDQNALEKKLEDLIRGMQNTNVPELKDGDDAMKTAENDLHQDHSRQALDGQGQALRDLEKAEKSIADDLRQSLMMFQAGMKGMGSLGGGMGNNGGGIALDGQETIKVPDHLQTARVREILDELQRRAGDLGRPKSERDYIERLLQNF